MAYDFDLADRIRECIVHLSNIEEKEMMGGLAFMYNDKMCVGVIGEELMARIDPDEFESAIEKTGCRPMDFTGRPMKGWIMVDYEGMKRNADLEYWISLAVNYNSRAKASKKK
jgi:TfoX/Sxy family transcriptional regulator of competence genes